MATLDELATLAAEYEVQPLATNTERAYRADWRLFREWCEEHGLAWDPPAVESVRLYVAQGVHDGRSAATLERRLSGISAGISALGHPGKAIAWHESVRKVLRGVKRERRSKGVLQKQATPLLLDDVRKLTGLMGDTDADRRDRTMLWIQFLTGMRPSELASLDVTDIRIVEQGLEVTVRQSKTDQEGRGVTLGMPRGSTPETCPVVAWTAWLDCYGVSEGPAFAPVTRSGSIRRGGDRRVTARAITEMIQRRTAGAGMAGNFSGNSPRRGYATQAKTVGVADDALKQHARWVKDQTMRKYVDRTDPWVANPATQFPL